MSRDLLFHSMVATSTIDANRRPASQARLTLRSAKSFDVFQSRLAASLNHTTTRGRRNDPVVSRLLNHNYAASPPSSLSILRSSQFADPSLHHLQPSSLSSHGINNQSIVPGSIAPHTEKSHLDLLRTAQSTLVAVIWDKWWVVLIVVTVVLLSTTSGVTWIELIGLYGFIKLDTFIYNNCSLLFHRSWHNQNWVLFFHAPRVNGTSSQSRPFSPNSFNSFNNLDSVHSLPISSNFDSTSPSLFSQKAPNYNPYLYPDPVENTSTSSSPTSSVDDYFKPKSFKLAKKSLMTPFPLNLNASPEDLPSGDECYFNLKMPTTAGKPTTITAIAKSATKGPIAKSSAKLSAKSNVQPSAKLASVEIKNSKPNEETTKHDGINFHHKQTNLMNSSMSEPTISELYRYCSRELIRITLNNGMIKNILAKLASVRQLYHLVFIEGYSIIDFVDDYGTMVLPRFANRIVLWNLRAVRQLIRGILWPFQASLRLVWNIVSFSVRNLVRIFILLPIILVASIVTKVRNVVFPNPMIPQSST